jgi:pimeloyl-ACP methyl ester carboxylesterase
MPLKRRQSPRGLSRRSLLFGGLALAGCAALRPTPEPPLARLYRVTATSPEQPPLVFIPGAFGSNLRDRHTGRELWPDSSLSLLLGRYDALELPIDPDRLEPITDGVEADGIFKDGLGQDFYGRTLHTLERVGGYQRRRPGDPIEVGQRNYYLYLYDWRLDNVAAVAGLCDLIQQIRRDYGDPRLKVDLLAHSNGGLLARYYLRYGRAPLGEHGAVEPLDPGADAVRQLIMVGAPNLGTIQPVLSHLRGEEIGLRNIRPEVIATCPGAPQLLPHPAVPWLVDLRGNLVRRDVFSIETWREFRWSIFDPAAQRRIIARHGGGATGRRYLEMLERYFDKQLVAGKRFVETLAMPQADGYAPTFLFGGDCEPTLARLVLERVDGRLYARERPGDIQGPLPGVDYEALMFEPGDLVVTRDSLEGRVGPLPPHWQVASHGLDADHGLPVQQSFFFCEEHRQLTGNATFQDNLLYTLLRHPLG